MNRNIVKSVIIIIALVIVGYFVVIRKTSRELFRTTSTQSSTSVSPLFKTQRWIGLNSYPGGISLRTAAGSNMNLLLKHNNAEIVYEYSPADKQLRSVSIETWNNAAGEVGDCNGQVGKEPWRIRIDRGTNRLLVDGKEVNGIAGKVHLRYQFTSRGDQVAVLSANGRKATSLLPFLGEGGASGTHFSQVFSFPGLVPTGAAVELPFTTDRVNFQSCWSSDERFIVYSDATDAQLSIVVVK